MQCLSCLLAHIILKLSYREVSHLIFSVKVYHKPTTPPTKVTRQKKAFWSPSTVSCLIELLFFFLFHSRVTSYTSNTAGKAVIRKQLWQTPGCPNNVTTMRDDCCLRLHIVDRWGVRSGVGRVVCSRYEFINKVSEDKGRLADAIPANSLQNRTEILGSCHVFVW